MDKKIIYGTLSAISILVVIVALVFVNLIVEKLNIQVDLTPKEMYSISDKTKQALSEVTDDTTIYVLSQTGKEDSTIKQILEEYDSNCSKLSIEYKDPYVYPAFAKDFAENNEDIANDSLIVVCGDKHKVISPSSLYQVQADYQTGSYQTTGITAESEITNAIKYVSMDKTPVIYYVSGHNELNMSETLKSEYEKMNFQIKTLNIAKNDGVPEDCDILFMTTPAVDYTDDEAQKVIDYLANDGRAEVFVDWGQEIPNFNKILSAYGVQPQNSIICEGDKDHYINNPVNVMPIIQKTDVTADLASSDYQMIIPMGQGIKTTDVTKSSINIESLLKTTSSAYGKTSKDPKSINFEDGDEKGPFDIAVAITDSYYTDKNHTTKLVVCGSSIILQDQGMTQGSLTFAINSASWLKGEASSIYIPPKSLEQETISIPDGTKENITIFVCAVMPIIIFGIGVYVWYKRRYS